jgi:hypothetical protein
MHVYAAPLCFAPAYMPSCATRVDEDSRSADTAKQRVPPTRAGIRWHIALSRPLLPPDPFGALVFSTRTAGPLAGPLLMQTNAQRGVLYQPT